MDANLFWGGDFSATPAGDLALVDGDALGQQRVLRRLLTNLKDYTWEPGYGGGLGQFVGGTAGGRTIEGLIRAQLLLEAAVSVQPEPRVVSRGSPDGNVFVDIAYADASSGSQQALSFSIGA